MLQNFFRTRTSPHARTIWEFCQPIKPMCGFVSVTNLAKSLANTESSCHKTCTLFYANFETFHFVNRINGKIICQAVVCRCLKCCGSWQEYLIAPSLFSQKLPFLRAHFYRLFWICLVRLLFSPALREKFRIALGLGRATTS